MLEIELINHLKSQNKPYVGIMPQGSFSNCVIRYEAGLLKPRTLESFFNKMGYVKNNGLWVKN